MYKFKVGDKVVLAPKGIPVEEEQREWMNLDRYGNQVGTIDEKRSFTYNSVSNSYLNAYHVRWEDGSDWVYPEQALMWQDAAIELPDITEPALADLL